MKESPSNPESWFARGDADLELASRAMLPEGPLPELAAYHAQQCAEKYLKGYLVAKRISFRFVHDLGYLVHLCTGTNPAFEQMEEQALRLTEYATESRYPREDDQPCTEQDAREAIALADGIRRFVRGHIGTGGGA